MQTHSRIKTILLAVSVVMLAVGLYLLMINSPGGRELFLNPVINFGHQFQNDLGWLSKIFSIYFR